MEAAEGAVRQETEALETVELKYAE